MGALLPVPSDFLFATAGLFVTERDVPEGEEEDFQGGEIQSLKPRDTHTQTL